MRTTWHTPPAANGMRLIDYLRDQLQLPSARAVKRLIDAGYCRRNGKVERFASTLLSEGDTIAMLVPDQQRVAPTYDPAAVLYEDDAFLAYNKPVGVTCDSEGILPLLRSKGRLFLVHRLDRDTTGVLLLAKTVAVRDALMEAFRQHTIRKQYLAIVDGVVREESGTITQPLAPKQRTEGQALWGVSPRGVPARTDWEVVKRAPTATLVRLFPHTGRTHQLRVHLSWMHHPIVGDTIYGRTFRCNYEALRQYLHAEAVALAHPITKEPLEITAPCPEDMATACRRLFR